MNRFNPLARLGALLTLACLTSCNGGDNADTADGGDDSQSAHSATQSDDAGEPVTLSANDDVQVFGTLRRAQPNNDRVILMFHQARSNRHEYDPTAPRLNQLGFDTLAVDQRSGGTMWDHDNQTVARLGKSTQYLYALPDLQAAVDWAVENEYQTIITVGSSYSAALNFILAEKNAGKLTAIACFSPGEYLGSPDLVKNAAANVSIPVYVTGGASDEEQERVDEVLSKTDSDKIVRDKPQHGVHGASTLRSDKNSEGAEENFAKFSRFLKPFSE